MMKLSIDSVHIEPACATQTLAFTSDDIFLEATVSSCYVRGTCEYAVVIL